MLGKLLKQEFRATARRMLPAMGVLTVLALLANLSIRVLDADLGGTLLKILMGLFIAVFIVGVIVAWVMPLVLMIGRFYRNLLKEEGYLMFTLPTNPHALIWSKLIVSTVWFAATAVLIMLLIFLTGVNLGKMSLDDFRAAATGMGQVLDALHEMGVTNASLILLVAEMALASVIFCLSTCLHFYAAMGIGQMSSSNKVLWSVLAFVGISILFSVLSSTMFSGFSRSGGMDVVVTSLEEMIETAPGVVRAISAGIGSMMLLKLLQGAILYAATSLTLSRKLNLA